MSCLVFYFPSEQTDWPKRKSGYPRGVIHCLRGRVQFDGNRTDVIVYPRYCGPNGRRIKDPIVFDESTTPPRLLRLPIGRESGSILVENSGHPAMPRFYIDAVGDIVRTSDGATVMENDPWKAPA